MTSTSDIETRLELLDAEITHLRKLLSINGQSKEEIYYSLVRSTNRINKLNTQLNQEADEWVDVNQITNSTKLNNSFNL